jgi:hypothetical protein
MGGEEDAREVERKWARKRKRATQKSGAENAGRLCHCGLDLLDSAREDAEELVAVASDQHHILQAHTAKPAVLRCVACVSVRECVCNMQTCAAPG